MSVTSGFFNSKNGDRKYNAEHVSSIFEGIIEDGIFEKIGDAFLVTAAGGNIVNVGTGKCWFNNTWTNNDAILPIDCGASYNSDNRMDAIAIKVDTSDTVRNNTIVCVKGAPSDRYEKPTFENTKYVHYYPLCYIKRPYGSTEITQGLITDVRFTEEAPMIIGALNNITIDDLALQWTAQLDELVENERREMEEQETSFKKWRNNQELVFDAWRDVIKNKLSEDAEIQLANDVVYAEIRECLITGYLEGTKTFSDDGLTITTSNLDGTTLTKTFSSDFSTCTSVLTASGVEIGRMTKTFSPDGKTIKTEHSIYF